MFNIHNPTHLCITLQFNYSKHKLDFFISVCAVFTQPSGSQRCKQDKAFCLLKLEKNKSSSGKKVNSLHFHDTTLALESRNSIK